VNEDGKRCERAGGTRGLCASHYSIARELVKAERTTWEKLETDGRAKPRSVRHGATEFFLNGKKPH
jgi:hypothetical protein